MRIYLLDVSVLHLFLSLALLARHKSPVYTVSNTLSIGAITEAPNHRQRLELAFFTYRCSNPPQLSNMLPNPLYAFGAILSLFAAFSVFICPAHTYSVIPGRFNPHKSLSYPSSPAPRLARRKDTTDLERDYPHGGHNGPTAAHQRTLEPLPSQETLMHPDLYQLTRAPLHCNDDLRNPPVIRHPHTHLAAHYRDRGIDFQQVCDARCFCDEQSGFRVDCRRGTSPGRPGYLMLLDCEAACRCERPV